MDCMRNVQSLVKTQNPRIGDVNVEDLADNRYIRKLDESGFFERIYSKQIVRRTGSAAQVSESRTCPRFSLHQCQSRVSSLWRRLRRDAL